VLTLFGMGVEYGCFSPDDRFLGIAPLCHGAGFAFNLAPLFFGGSCDLMAGFDPEHTARHLHNEGPTGVFMVPTHFRALFDLPDPARALLSRHRLRAIISNAAALPQELKEEIVATFGDGLLHECYGSTEGGIVTSLRPPDQLRKVRCVGLPFVNTAVRLLDDDGREVRDGEVGELFSYSPYLFSGYWEKPEKTRECMRDGWVSAGDLARRDDEGYLYIVDRKKDMVVSGGINIYPRQVENVLNGAAGIAESAVVGVPDRRWGERLEAVYVPAGDGPDEDALRELCTRELGSQKTPKAFHAVDALPRNPMGKVLKKNIVDALAAKTTEGEV
jgi:long-chain acyl-CoA synthetase